MSHEKAADDLTAGERAALPKRNFARPAQAKTEKGKKEPGSYPIPDKQHARSALGFAAMHHGRGSAVYQQVADKVRQKFPSTSTKESSLMKITEQAAIREMAAYIIGLGNRVPGEEKTAAMHRTIKLAQALFVTGDLNLAIREVYPEKPEAWRVKWSTHLINRFHRKRAAIVARLLKIARVPRRDGSGQKKIAVAAAHA